MVHDLNLLEAAVAVAAGGGGGGRDSGTASLYFQVGEYEAALWVQGFEHQHANQSVVRILVQHQQQRKHHPYMAVVVATTKRLGQTSPTRGHRELEHT